MQKKVSLSSIYVLATFAMLFWGMSFIWSKIVFKYYSPIATITLRLFFSSIILYFILYFFYRSYLVLPKGNWKLFLLLTFFEPFLYYIGESFGLQKVDATITAVTVSTIPIFNAIVGFYIFRENLTKINIFGIIISFIGILCMIIKDNFQFYVSIVGMLWLLLAVLSAVGYGISVKKATMHYHPVYIIFVQNIIAFFFFLPIFIIGDLGDVIQTSVTQELVSSLLYLSFFASSLAFIFHTYVIQQIGIGKANVFLNLIPIFTSIASYFLLKESFTYSKIVGIGLVLAGLYLAQIHRKIQTDL